MNSSPKNRRSRRAAASRLVSSNDGCAAASIESSVSLCALRGESLFATPEDIEWRRGGEDVHANKSGSGQPPVALTYKRQSGEPVSDAGDLYFGYDCPPLRSRPAKWPRMKDAASAAKRCLLEIGAGPIRMDRAGRMLEPLPVAQASSLSVGAGVSPALDWDETFELV